MKLFGITIFSLILAVFIQADNAYASTYSVGNYGDIYSTVNINKTDYAPSEQIYVTTSIFSNYGAPGQAMPQAQVDLTATTTGNPITTVIPSQSIWYGQTIYGNAILNAPASGGSYAVNFVTGTEEVETHYNYWYVTDAGAITGVCDVPASYYNLKRDTDTEQSAVLRGVTKVIVEFEVTTDNYPTYCERILHGEFLPGELEVTGYFLDGRPMHDFCSGGSNYCSAFAADGTYNGHTIQEFF
jgi:hypothetical protein